MLLLVPRLALTEARPAAEIAYDKSQSAVGQPTGRHLLTDHQGRELDIASLRGRPLVVSLVFTSCASVCPILTDHLRNQVERARRALGEESFNVLTFGFDASGDRPAQLAGFANTHRLSGIGGWYIASADERTTAAFLEELGFSFQAAAGGFDHVTQTTVLDPEGRVHAQIYGQDFPLPVLIEPLKELVLGKSTRSLAPADLWDRISFLCTVYDPARSAYRFDYGIFFGMFFGGFSLLITGLVILRLWLQRRRAIRQLPPSRRGMA
jgi:protein SCO1/2